MNMDLFIWALLFLALPVISTLMIVGIVSSIRRCVEFEEREPVRRHKRQHKRKG